MSEKIHKALLEDGPCLSPEELRDYHDGKLNAEGQHKVEVHLLHCDLCSGALDGIVASGLSAEDFSADVEEINNRAWKRVEALHRKPNRRPILWMSAASLLLIGISASWFWYNSVSQDKQMEAVFAEQFQLPEADSLLLASAQIGRDSLALNNPSLASGEVVQSLSDKSSEDAQKQLISPGAGATVTSANDPARRPEANKIMNDNEDVSDESVAEESPDGFSSIVYAPPYPVNSGKTIVTESKKEEVKNLEELDQVTISSEGSFRDKTSPTKSKNAAGKDLEREKQDRKQDAYKVNRQDMAGAKPSAPAVNNATPAPVGFASGDDDADGIVSHADSVSATFGRGTPSGLAGGLGAYKAQDYRSAVDQFNEVLREDPNHQEANFYAGVSYLGLNDAQKAIPCLERARSGTNPSLSEDAEWYLSLAYLKSKNKSKAEPLLRTIESRADGRYRANAADALEDLRKP